MRKLITPAVKLKLLFTCLLALLLLTACGDNGNDETDIPHDLLDIARERRLNIIANRPTHEQLLALTQGREPETIDLTQFVSGNTGQSITAAEAIEDVELFFTVLRQVYGPYIYFGGDTVFAPIFDEIIAEIATHETILPFQLENMIYHALNPVVNDNHFVFGNNRFGQSANFFTSAVPFDRDERGFIHRASGRVVAEIEGRDMYDVLRLSMDEQGNVFYSAVIYELGPAGMARRNLSIVFEGGDSMTLPLEQHRTTWPPFTPPSLEWVDGVPVVALMSMGFTMDGEFSLNYLETFLTFVEEIRHEPVVIVDLRHNWGGSNSMARLWLHNLARELVPQNFTGLFRHEYNAMIESWEEMQGYFSADELIFLTEIAPLDAAHIIFYDKRNVEIVESGQLIIMLIDRLTFSAAESFTDAMFSMANTLVVGQNTYGGLIGRSNLMQTLPNSGIDFIMGSALHVFAEGLYTEGVGIAPDVWVHGDALAAALALLANND